MVVHERIVDVDDDARRLAYTVVDGPFTHHHATFAVTAEPDGTSVLTWVSDLLPDDVAPMVEDLMDQGAAAAQHAGRWEADAMTVRLTIGEFSKMTYLSVKALRHYHDVGLLEPAEIDPAQRLPALQRRPGADRPGDPPLPRPRHADRAGARGAPGARPRHPQPGDPRSPRGDAGAARAHAAHGGVAPGAAHHADARRSRSRTAPCAATPALAIARHGRLRRRHRLARAPPTPSCTAALDAAGLSPAGPDGALYHDAFFTEGNGDVVAYVPVGVDLADLAGRHRPRRTPRAARHPGGGDDPRGPVRRPRPDLRRPRHRGGRARPRSRGPHPRDLPGRRPRRGLLAHHPKETPR